MQTPISKTGVLIAPESLELLQGAIDTAEGRASQRCVPAKILLDLAADAESRFDELLVTKAERLGATMTLTAEGPGKSYPRQAHGTQVQIVRRTKGWYIINAERVAVYPGNDEKRRFALTDAQKAAARDRFERKLQAV